MWVRNRGGGGAEIRVDPAARIQGRYYDDAEQKEVRYSVRNLRGGMLVSLFAGSLSGLLGIGGGLVKVPAMNMVCGVPIKAATATSNFMIGVTAAASAYIYYARGYVDPMVAVPVALGITVGALAGSRVAPHVRGGLIVVMLSVVIVALSVQMVLAAFGLSVR
jgi:uncharacterized membrane protein YfcA